MRAQTMLDAGGGGFLVSPSEVSFARVMVGGWSAAPPCPPPADAPPDAPPSDRAERFSEEAVLAAIDEGACQDPAGVRAARRKVRVSPTPAAPRNPRASDASIRRSSKK